MVQTQTEKFCGKKTYTETPTSNIPVPTARPTDGAGSSCAKQYQELKQSCDLAINDSKAACDEKNSGALANAANNAKATSDYEGSNSSVQGSCGQTKKVSQDAKDAMTSYRDTCSGSISSCSSSCSELASFLNKNQCLSEIGLTQTKAQEMITSNTRSCTAQQAQVDDADRAVSSYSDTNSDAEKCQASSMGLPQLPSAAAEAAAASEAAKTYCEANPTAPGCGSAVADCNNPSQANNKVCVCAKNPSHTMCGVNALNAGSNSLASSGTDSESRLNSPEANLDPSADLNNMPDIVPRAPSSGDSEGIDGRQGGAAVGNSTVGNGGGSGGGKGHGGAGDDPQAIGGGSYGGGGGGSGSLAYANRSGGGDGGAGGRRANGVGGDAGKSPDLRQFLPGGMYDPKLKGQGIAGAVGPDGITGPHSSNWNKIQNRFQVLKHTLEP